MSIPMEMDGCTDRETVATAAVEISAVTTTDP